VIIYLLTYFTNVVVCDCTMHNTGNRSNCHPLHSGPVSDPSRSDLIWYHIWQNRSVYSAGAKRREIGSSEWTAGQ